MTAATTAAGRAKSEIFQYGVNCHRGQRLAEAEAAYRQVLALDPEDADALHLLGLVADQTGRPGEAAERIGQAIRLKGDRPHYHHNLALALRNLGRLDQAETACRQALALKPDYPLAHSTLGMIERAAGKLDEAAAAYRAALGLQPIFPEALNNLGNVLCQSGDYAGGEAQFRAALAQPGSPAVRREAQYNLAQVLLLTGRLEEGWRYYEVRAEVNRAVRTDLIGPAWDGRPTGERTLLLYGEQGLGDTLQFCRFAPIVAASGSRVVLQLQRPLLALLRGLPDLAGITALGDPLPAYHAHAALMSVPRLIGIGSATIPSAPYLAADPARAADWRRRLAGFAGLRVGLVWAGGLRPDQPWAAAVDRRRSITLAQMAPLAAVPGVSFLSLQKDQPAAQAANPPPGMVLHDFTAELKDFTDTAALIEALDLVISVDTAVAHLAGALGKPVWLLNRFDTCWRWLLDRDDSPWYPSLRQFRQPRPGDWASVMAAARNALAELAQGGRR
jgi:Flp pilus assembly protein TadD